MNINLDNLSKDEIAMLFFNDVMQPFLHTIGMQGIIEQLCSFSQGESGDSIEPSIAATKEEKDSWKRDYEKLTKIKLEN